MTPTDTGDEAVPEGVWAAAPPRHREKLSRFRDQKGRFQRWASIFTKVTVVGIIVLAAGVLCSLFGSFSGSSDDVTQLGLEPQSSAWTVVARWLYIVGGVAFVIGIIGAVALGLRAHRPLPEFTRSYVILLDGAPGTGLAVQLQEARAESLASPASDDERDADSAISDLIDAVGRTQAELQETANMTESAAKMTELDALIARMQAALDTMRERTGEPGIWEQVVRDCRE